MLLTIIGLHGFSLSTWHEYIDSSPQKEIILGKARAIRSDDWLVQLPFSLSQRVSPTPFSIANPLIGAGHNDLRVVHSIPIFHWIGIFRPESFGYFFGDDFGISWHWWFCFLGLLYSSFLFFNILSRNNFWLSLGGVAALLFSPFVQFWSLNCAPLVISFNFLFFSFASCLQSRSLAGTAASAILFLWSAGCFVFFLYPPYQVTLGYLFLFLATGYVLHEKIASFPKLALKAFSLGAATLLLSGLLYRFFLECHGTIQLLQNTVYPGHRLQTGGGLSLFDLFSNLCVPSLWTHKWEAFRGNICETASFYFLFPITITTLLLTTNYTLSPMAVSLMGFVAFELFWMFIGFPAPLNRLTLFSNVPETRALLALGIADLALFVMMLANNTIKNFRLLPAKRAALFSLFVLGVCLAILYLQIHHRIPGVRSTLALGIIFILFLFLSYNILTFRKTSLVGLVTLSIVSTIGFNPLARGGSAYLKTNNVSKTILGLSKPQGNRDALQGPLWVYFGNPALGDLFRILGVRSLGGVHFQPDLQLWKSVDPSGQYMGSYNRYAHVSFSNAETGKLNPTGISFDVPSPDTLVVKTDTDSLAFHALNPDFMLVTTSDPDYFKKKRSLKYITTVDGINHFFKVLR